MEGNIVKLEFEALPENQGFARSVVSAYCVSLDPTLEELTEIKTAVSEAVSNAIIHGYERKGTGQIEMELKTMDKDKVYIKITDYGKGIRDIKRLGNRCFPQRKAGRCPVWVSLLWRVS